MKSLIFVEEQSLDIITIASSGDYKIISVHLKLPPYRPED